MFIKVNNDGFAKYPYTLSMLRADNPNISFGKAPPATVLAEFGVHKVVEQEFPQFDPTTHIAIQAQQPSLVDGVWVLAWQVREKTQSELEQEAQTAAARVRAERNARIAASDWTQGKDIADNISTAWATYRQALRDVPAQAGFPWTVEWPVQP